MSISGIGAAGYPMAGYETRKTESPFTEPGGYREI